MMTMGVKPAQGELNTAHIRQARLIHDDLIVAVKSLEEDDWTILQVMQAISRAGLTLNSVKCQLERRKSHFEA